MAVSLVVYPIFRHPLFNVPGLFWTFFGTWGLPTKNWKKDFRDSWTHDQLEERTLGIHMDVTFPDVFGKTSAQIRQVWTEVDKSHNSWTDGSMVDYHYGG